MRIVFMGTPEFSVPILEALIKEYEVVLVVTQPDKEVGRKKILEPTPVKKCAMENGIEVFTPSKISKEYEEVLKYNPDMIITAAFGQFIPDVLLNAPKYGAVNVHGSLLPKYRGGSPVQTSIINGETYTGITIMRMVKKMDAGAIISQAKVEILDSDNNETLFEKMSYVGRDLLLETLPSIFNGTHKEIEQNEEEATFAYNITHEEQFINWHKPSRCIFNQIRGLANEPGALTSINGILFKVFSSEIVEYVGNEEPGTILDLNKKLLVKTNDGALSIKFLQQSGKNKMDIKSFLNGQHIISVGLKFSEDII